MGVAVGVGVAVAVGVNVAVTVALAVGVALGLPRKKPAWPVLPQALVPRQRMVNAIKVRMIDFIRAGHS